MIHKLEEIEDTEPGRRIVEEAVAIGGDIEGAEIVHPEGLDVDGVVGCQIECCVGLVGLAQVMSDICNALNGKPRTVYGRVRLIFST